MVSKLASANIHEGYSVATTLDPAVQPFLRDHKIDGTPVLPGVMGIEAFAEAALCVLPGWRVEAIEDVKFLAPFKFFRGEPREVRTEVRVHPHGNRLIADCRLIGHRSLPNQTGPQGTTHFTARVLLNQQALPAAPTTEFAAPSGNSVEAGEIYGLYFHGPAYQVLEKAWWDGKQVTGLLAKDLPPNHSPAEFDTITSPRLVELCFQTAGIWELGIQGRMGLPQEVREVRLLRDPKLAEGRLHAVVSPDGARGIFDAEVIDKRGNCYLSVIGYRTIALSNAVDEKSLRTLQAIMAGEAVLVA